MTILGIESSCDETSAAVVENGTKLLSLVTATSQDMHAKYGGIIPDRAAREQLKSILPVIHESLTAAHQKPETLDAIAVTVGPGLIGSLLIGVETAKALSLAWNKPLIPVNHLIGHIFANWLVDPAGNLPRFPALVLLVSGGHTELILMSNYDKFKLLGSTLDDAAGECFDKCGRLLNLPYPFGPYIEKEADKYKLISSKPSPLLPLPRPLINSHSFDFSFSGLKTAFLHEFHRLKDIDYKFSTPYLAFELQEAITDVLVSKLVTAAQKYLPKSVLICGGVSANQRLREKLALNLENSKLKTELFIPPVNLCTDSAAYIASAAYFNYKHISGDRIYANPGLDIL